MKTNEPSANLKTVLDTSAKLREAKSKEIQFSAPILIQNGNAVIFPHTINVIQGQAGVHKSRLAETICAAILKKEECWKELLGYKVLSAKYKVVYVDTERNLAEQFPYALQSIQVKAGYFRSDHPENFEYISLLQIARKDRFGTLNEYLQHLRESTSEPLFIVLDVSTDCIEDFNKSDKSMELIDLMNIAINEHNVIFLCLIHENPKSDKARGHFGTELMNKASTVMQVAFGKDGEQSETDIIKVRYLKCRSTARHTPFYMKYDEIEKGLVLASESDISNVVNYRKTKAPNEHMIEHIEMYLGDGTQLSRKDFLDKLCTEFKAAQRTIETRLNEIANHDFTNENGRICKLVKIPIKKVIYYSLEVQ